MIRYNRTSGDILFAPVKYEVQPFMVLVPPLPGECSVDAMLKGRAIAKLFKVEI